MPEFSVFALGTGASRTDVTDASLEQASIGVDEKAIITATVENRGQATAEETVELTLDGDVVDAETIHLEGGESQDVMLGFTPEDAGEYSLAVGPIELEQLTAEASTEEPADATDEPDGSSSWVVHLLLTLVTASLLAVFPVAT